MTLESGVKILKSAIKNNKMLLIKREINILNQQTKAADRGPLPFVD